VPRTADVPEGIAAISLPTPFAIGAVNAYLLEGEPLTLLDPGPNVEGALAALEEGLQARGRRLEDLELVLVTHQHHDHIGLAARVRERSGATVAATASLATFLADYQGAMDADDAYAVATMRRHGIEDELARRLEAVSRRWRHVGAGVAVDRVLREGEALRAGGRDLEVLARPGHSPTDTAFLDRADGVLLGGDHLLEHISSNPIAHAPIGAADPAAVAAAPDRPRPLVTYMESFARTRETDVSVVLPGHGPPFAGHRELIDARVALHARRAERILRRIDGRSTAAEVARGLWRRLSANDAYLALSEVLGHVDLLAAQGRVHEEVDGDVVRLAPV
jgi:glyoxylase-like metal-dependent hydrolase (beta-lactamase superfamily II)